jgi:hypothetical protein
MAAAESGARIMSLRPTATQAIGRGGYLGALMGVIGAVVGLVVALVVDGPVWVALLVPPIAGGAAGAAVALAFGRHEGADVDDIGVRPVPDIALGLLPWQRIEDLRTERRRGRLGVAVYLTGGRSVRLPAPYDGRLLGADPQFERKLIMLRHLWETHRHARYLDPAG